MTAPELRDYQKFAVSFLHGRKRAGLFMDMGLGKTCICLTALTPDHLPALVVAPKRVAENTWTEERDLWRPDLSIRVAAASQTGKNAPKPVDQRLAALTAGADITVIGRDNFAEVLGLRSKPWKTVIIDESSGYKKKTSVRWRGMNRLVNRKDSRVQHVWALTGTPSPNGLMDLWSQVYLLDKGASLFTTLGEYRQRFFRAAQTTRQGIVTKWEPREGMDAQIMARIEGNCLSMGTEGRVHLPDVTYNEIKVTLPAGPVMQAYIDLVETLVANLEILGGMVHTAKNAAILTNKLAQLCAGFLYGDDYDLTGEISVVHRLKAQAVKEVVEGSGGSPVLVFYGFDHEVKVLKKVLEEYSPRMISERGVIQDWNKGKVQVLLAHPQSAGHGLNLQHGGHTIVWSTLPWGLEEWQQANKRLHRSGQKNPVVIHKVMAYTPRGGKTVDHVKEDRLAGKGSVQDLLLQFVESPL
jgi:SNF2 family DNA or RNA helicase